ncbi:NAD(P)H quinone oxidoreductase [Streptomyces viridiviolaceus]|uniref:Zinc-binding dehydrogenase n=1 Tax=Streptomyces viridiviolaceus TaxID=68282 RepID=A0ABW2EBP9_9ACTN|nr:zinc-binding dehydrogenase [Streptomyces viridiviolaceus]GHB67402.1 NAD(P)H quinone oxidoreductase [Streptomyces viridiviolaceus]
MSAPSLPETMTAAVLERPVGPDGIRVQQVPLPRPGPGEALVRVRAATVISSELSSLWGVADPDGPSYPMVLGNEFAGEVVVCPGGEVPLGQKVTTAWAGHGWTRDGGHAEYVLTNAADLITYESTLDFTTVAAMPKAFTRAGLARRTLRWEPGQVLLVRGGTTAIGLAAASIARADGLTVVATSRSETKRTALERLGFGHAVLDDVQLVAHVREFAPDGVDVALDTLGYPAVADTMRCVAEGGTVALIGLLEEQTYARHSGRPLDGRTAIAPSPFHYIPHGVRLTTAKHKSLKPTDSLRDFFGELQPWLDGVEDGRYQVVVDREFPLAEVADAYHHLAHQDGVGKVVIRVG